MFREMEDVPIDRETQLLNAICAHGLANGKSPDNMLVKYNHIIALHRLTTQNKLAFIKFFSSSMHVVKICAFDGTHVLKQMVNSRLLVEKY